MPGWRSRRSAIPATGKDLAVLLHPAVVLWRNRLILLGDQVLFVFASRLFDSRTLLPAFVAHYTSSLVLIALVPAIWSGVRLLPRLVAAHVLRARSRTQPWLVGAALISRLPMAATPALLLIGPHAPVALILTLFYLSLVLFSLGDSFVGVAWYDILARTLPSADRPWLFGSMMVGGAVMGLGAGLLATVVLASPHWPFPRNFALLFTLAAGAPAVACLLYTALVEPVRDPQPRDVHWASTLGEARRLLGDGGPFARLMGVQLLPGLPVLAAGLYTPYALGPLGLPLDAAGLFVAATAVGAMPGGVGLPPVARRWGSPAVVAATAVATILTPLTVALASGFPTVLWVREALCVTSFVCQGLAMTGAFIGINDLILAMAPAEERTLAVGLANTVPGLLFPLPLLGGMLAQWVGVARVLWLCTLPGVGAVVALRGVRWNRQRDRNGD
jgi:MFS family permease